jgi:ubiquinone/menaquinone biosynthesis C-methylase UbiE
MDHTQIIKERLTKGITNPQIRELVLADYAYTFHELGLDENSAKEIADKVVSFIESSATLNETEEKVRALFTGTKVGDKNIFELIQLGLTDRVNKIVVQITPHLQGIKGKVFDYGIGAGEVTQKLKDELSLNIEGGDVRDFRSHNVTVPFVMLGDSADGDGKIVNVADKYYEAAVLTNVIHHEKVNDIILKELDRIVAKKLVIIETVPVGNTPEEIALDHERTFANDTLWNRFFNYADIPVPGTYETPEDWIRRFESYGWKTTHSEDLGYDQKSIHDVHHLLVFER